MRLGIDFGTTHTVVAAAECGRYPVASFRGEDGFKDHLPGVAHFNEGAVFCGDEARRDDEGTSFRSVKALVSPMMPDAPILQDDPQTISALELTTEYLRYVHRMILKRSNLQIAPDEKLEVTIAVPAHANTRQRYLTLEAFQAAGFDVLGLVNEPTAGAVEYVHHSPTAVSGRSPKKYVLVYDLGGGTFDAAAVSLKEGRFDLIGAEGRNSIGGNNFDEIIARHAARAAGVPEATLKGAPWERLLDLACSAKEGLAPSARKIFLESEEILGCDTSLDLTPIYDDCRPLIEETLSALDGLLDGLRAHGIDPESSRELGAVYLVGGSVMFPLVQKLLRQRFGRKVQVAPQSYASTAVGLAIASDDEAGIFVREAPTRHFGVWRETEGGLDKIFDPIIEKRHGVRLDGPLHVERIYRPAHAVGRLRFVECTDLDPARTPRGEVTPWESVLFPYDPALQSCDDLSHHLTRKDDRLMAEEILERYEYAPTGVVKVHIENRTRGYARDYILGKPSAA